jgi:small subunit ribosomal protein S17
MKGIVHSNKMEKALVVTVYDKKFHPLYKKAYQTKKRYKVACSDSKKFTLGSSVEITETRPISKTIRWKVIED